MGDLYPALLALLFLVFAVLLIWFPPSFRRFVYRTDPFGHRLIRRWTGRDPLLDPGPPHRLERTIAITQGVLCLALAVLLLDLAFPFLPWP